MKTYEVEVDVPSKTKDWCIYDEREVWVRNQTTTAILTARNEDRLKEKVKKHYGEARIVRIREIQ